MNPEERHLSIEDLLNDDEIDPKELHKHAARLTRRKLLLAAAQCFAAKGYQKTTIREIATNAGVTLGAVYHHFKDKKALLMTLNRQRQITSRELLRKALAQHEDSFDALRAALLAQNRILADDPIIRGVTREYMGMVMTDPDFNRMHNQVDVDFRNMAATELEHRYPSMSKSERDMLFRMLYVAAEGLLTALVVGSPVIGSSDEIIDSLINTLRREAEKHETGAFAGKRSHKTKRT